jgi:hypothetical protein
VLDTIPHVRVIDYSMNNVWTLTLPGTHLFAKHYYQTVGTASQDNFLDEPHHLSVSSADNFRTNESPAAGHFVLLINPYLSPFLPLFGKGFALNRKNLTFVPTLKNTRHDRVL